MKTLLYIILLCLSSLSTNAQDVNGTPVSTPYVPGKLYFIYIFRAGFDAVDLPKVLISDSISAHLGWKSIFIDSVWQNNNTKAPKYLFAFDSATKKLNVIPLDSLKGVQYSTLAGLPTLATVATTGSYLDLNNKPTIPTLVSQLTNDAGYITASSTNTLTNKSGNISQWTNNSGYLTSITSGMVTTALGYTPPNPSGSTSQYIRGDGSLATFPSIPSGTVTSIGLSSSDFSISGSPITTSGNITANLNTSGVTPGTYEYFTVNSKGIITNAYNSVNNALSTRTFGTAYQASNTSRIYDVDFTVSISIGSGILSTSTGRIDIEISANGTSGWTAYGRDENGNTGVLAAQNSQTVQIFAKDIPAGYYYRLTSTVVSGAATFSNALGGHEILKR